MRGSALALAMAVLFSLCVCLGARGQNSFSPQQENDKQDTKKKDKQDKGKAGDAQDSAVFSQAMANRLLSDLRDGLVGLSRRRVLSAFDPDKMEGYLTFEDQIETMFQHYDSLRVYYRIAQSTVEGSKGIVLVDFEMEEVPRSGGTPLRRNGQVRFEMERGRKGWKIVDFNPRGFFS